MGLFDSLAKAAKNVAKDAVRDTVNKAINDVTGGIRPQQTTAQTQHATAAQAPAQGTYGEAAFAPICLPGSRECKEFGGGVDANDEFYDLYVYFDMHKDFKRFDTGAMEIPIAYLYAPETPDDEVEYEETECCVSIGVESTAHSILDNYLEKGIIKSGAKIEKMSGCIADYRITYEDKDFLSIYYCLNKDKCRNSEPHATVQIPKSKIGTAEAELAKKALDQLLTTYREEDR